MSTKVTLAYGDDFHLYQEVGDDFRVYIEIERSMFVQSDPYTTTIVVPLTVWEVMREKTTGLDLSLANLSGEEIHERAVRGVEERLERMKKKHGPFTALFGAAIYGSIDDPKEEQVARAEAYYHALRIDVREVVAKIAALKKENEGCPGIHEINMKTGEVKTTPLKGGE